MKKKASPPLLYADEHLICSEYNSAQSDTGFSFHTIQAGERYSLLNRPLNYLFFLLEGEVEIYYGKEIPFSINKKKFFILPKMTNLECIAKTDLTFIVHFFDKVVNFCDKIILQEVTRHAENVSYKVPLLEIRSPLDDFLSLLAMYLNSGMLCRHMHEIKQKELFFLLRAFYTKEENATLFAPIANQITDFKNMVVQNAPKAKSIRELSQYCNYSLATFNRLFRKYFNTTPSKWILQQKLKEIAMKLSDEAIPISEIIEEFDFSSPAHFTTFCKKHLNMTPRQFREKSTKEQQARIDKIYNR